MSDMKYYWARVKFHDKYTPEGKYSEHDYSTNRAFKSFEEFLESFGFSDVAKKKDPLFEYSVEERLWFDTYEELQDFTHSGCDVEAVKAARKLPVKSKSTREVPESDDDFDRLMDKINDFVCPPGE